MNENSFTLQNGGSVENAVTFNYYQSTDTFLVKNAIANTTNIPMIGI